jgi:hypothetical protein
VTYGARSWIEALHTLFRGVARRIMCLAKEVGDLRAFLMVSIWNTVPPLFVIDLILQTISQNEKDRRARELSSQVDGSFESTECGSITCQEPMQYAYYADGLLSIL